MTPDQAFTAPQRVLLVSAALVIVIAGVHAASSVVGPFLLAVFVAVVATPALRRLQRFGWPTWAGVLLVAFLLLDIGGLMALLGSGALDGFRNSLPGYQERLVLLTAQFANWLEGLGVEGSREAVPNLFSPTEIIGLTRTLLASVSGIVAEGLLILLTVVFILLEASTLPAKLKVAMNTTADADARFQQLFEAPRLLLPGCGTQGHRETRGTGGRCHGRASRPGADRASLSRIGSRRTAGLARDAGSGAGTRPGTSTPTRAAT